MSNRWMYGLLWLLASCASKYKLTSKHEESKLAYSKSKELVLGHYISAAAQEKVDSNYNDHWIKIYSQGKVSITKDKFEGEADSIFWYGKGKEWQSESKLQNTGASMVRQVDAEKVLATENSTQIKEKEKSSFAWWLVLVTIGLMVCLYAGNRWRRK